MKSVLIVDDNTEMRHLLRRLLQAQALQVSEAENGESALAMLRTNEYALMVTDIIMPGIEGIELIGEAKAAHPTMKIIAMSGALGSGRMNVLDLAQAFGADAVLAKPFRPAAMLAEVQRLIG